MIRILQRIGWLFVDNWRIIVPAVAVFVIVIGLWSYCGKRNAPKLNEAEIQKAQQAIEQHNDEKLKEVLAAADAREQGIDANVARSDANTKQAVEDAKKKYSDMNTDELAAELEKRK